VDTKQKEQIEEGALFHPFLAIAKLSLIKEFLLLVETKNLLSGVTQKMPT